MSNKDQLAKIPHMDSRLCQICHEPIVKTLGGVWVHKMIYQPHNHIPKPTIFSRKDDA